MKDGLDREAKFFKDTLADLSEIIRKASGAMGAAVKFMGQGRPSGDKEGITKELVEAISRLNDKFSEEIDKESELVKTIEQLHEKMEEERKSRISSEKKRMEGEDRLTKAVSSLAEKINGLKNRVSDPSSKLSRAAGGGEEEESSRGRRSFRSASKKPPSLKEMGFKPKGTDTIPAMLTKNEYVMNTNATKMYEPILRLMNKGYVKGGKVKPEYHRTPGRVGAAGRRGGATPTPRARARARATGTSNAGPTSGGRGGGGGGPVVVGGGMGGEEWGRAAAEALTNELAGKQNKKWAAQWAGVSTILLGGQVDIFEMLFSGAVRDITHFRKEARGLAFELEGMNSSTRGMQNSFTDMGKVSAQTGQRLDVMQKVYMNNMKKGFKGQGAELKKTLKSGLYLSTMIGSEAGETADMFADWNRMLGMSGMKMKQMASDMKNVARNTGVTGSELLGAMKSSEGILRNLRGQNNLTSGASKNVISAMAVAKKMGIEDSAEQTMSMMTSTPKFFEGDPATKRFLMRMTQGTPGGMDEVIDGVAMDNQALLMSMAGEMDKNIREITKGRVGGVDDMRNASREDKRLIAQTLNALYKMDMHQFKGHYAFLQESGKDLARRFDDLGKEIDKNRDGTEGYRLAQEKMNDLMVGSGMTFGRKLADAADMEGVSFADAVSRVTANMTDTERKDMATLTGKLSPELQAKTAGMGAERDYARSLLVASQAMAKRGKDAGMNVKDFGPEIIAAMEQAKATGDSTELKKVVNEMDETSNKIDVELKSLSDPISQLSKKINDLNETLRENMGGPLGMLIDKIGWLGLALGGVGLAASSLHAQFGDLGKIISDLAPSGSGGALSRIKDFQTSVIETFSATGARITQIQLWWIKQYRRFWLKLRQLTDFDNVVAGIRLGFGKLEGAISFFSDMLPTDAKFIENAFGNIRSGLRRGYDNVVAGVRWGFGKLEGAISFFSDMLPTDAKFIENGIMRIKSAFNYLSNMKISSPALNFRSIINGIGSAVMFLVKLPFNIISGSFKMMGTTLRNLGNVVKKVPIIGWLFMAVDGVIGAVEGYKKAGSIFGVETDKLTQGMKISAGAAGGVVGVLDGLTFGLLRATGAAGPLTEFLAKLFYGFTYLAKGFQDSFMSWMPAIQDSLKNVGQAFGELWTMFAGIFGFDVSSEADGWKAFYEMMGIVGNVLGTIVGGGLKLLVDILYAAVQVIKAVVWYVSIYTQGLMALWTALTTMSFQPIIDWWNKLGTDILGALGKVFSDMSSWIGSWFGFGKKKSPTPPPTPAPGTATITIPAGAEGGIVNKPTTALIGEAGPEALIPLDRLGSVMGEKGPTEKLTDNSKTFFTAEKSLATQKKLQTTSEDSKKKLASMDKVISRGERPSDGLYVHDVYAESILHSILEGIGSVAEGSDALLNFMANETPGGEEKLKRARSQAKDEAVSRKMESAKSYEKNKDRLMTNPKIGSEAVLMEGAYRSMMSRNPNRNNNLSLTQEEWSNLELNTLKDYNEWKKKISEEAASPSVPPSSTPSPAATTPPTPPSAAPSPAATTPPAPPSAAPSPAATTPPAPPSETPSPAALTPPAPKKGEFDYLDVPGTEPPVMEVEMADVPKSMWTAEEQNADRMLRQHNLYRSSNQNMEQSIINAQESDEMLGSERLMFANGKSLSESSASVEDSIQANPKIMQDSIMAVQPGEDPNLLYESRSKMQAQYQEKAAAERANVEMQKKQLADLKKTRSGMWGAGFGGWAADKLGLVSETDKAQLQMVDNQIAAIEGKKANEYSAAHFFGMGSTDASVGSLEVSQARLKTWEREAKDPSSRDVIGENVWTGQSDTSVVFPHHMTDEGVNYAVKTGYQTEVRGERSMETPPPSEAIQRNFDAIERFASTLESAPTATPEASANEAILDQNIEQNQKLGTMEESAARSLEPGSIYTHDIHLEKLLSEIMGGDALSKTAEIAAAAMETASLQQATPVGQHAVPVMRDEEGAADVQPVHLRDIAESILRDRAGSEAGNGKLQSDELVGIEEVSNKQYEEMRQIREGIETMIGLLRPSAGTVGTEQGPAGKSTTTKRNVTPTVYGQLRNGQPGSGANKAVQKPFR